jgi:hypothetical protein
MASLTQESQDSVDRVIKACETSMHNVILLEDEVRRLRIENERQKKKRRLKKSYLGRQKVLLGAQGSQLVLETQDKRPRKYTPEDEDIEVIYDPIILPAATPAEPTPQITCYICRGYDHDAAHCSEYRM